MNAFQIGHFVGTVIFVYVAYVVVRGAIGCAVELKKALKK